MGGGEVRVALADLAGRVVELPLRGPGRMLLQPGAGGLAGMGTSERSFTWTDAGGGPAFYYVRAHQTDGETAWSSPVWVDLPGG